MPSSPSQPRSWRNGLGTYLKMRKRSTLSDMPTSEEPRSTTGNSELGLDKSSHKQQLDRAEIVVSSPTHHLQATPIPLPFRSRLILITYCDTQCHTCIKMEKRKIVTNYPPRWSATSLVFIERGDDMGGETIHEEPASIKSQSPLTSIRQGPALFLPYPGQPGSNRLSGEGLRGTEVSARPPFLALKRMRLGVLEALMLGLVVLKALSLLLGQYFISFTSRPIRGVARGHTYDW